MEENNYPCIKPRLCIIIRSFLLFSKDGRNKIKNKENGINHRGSPFLLHGGRLIQLVDVNDVIKKRIRNIKKQETTSAPNRKYHLLRWKIKRFLIKENIIKKCMSWKTILDIFDLEIVNKEDFTDIEIKEIFYKYGYSIIEHHTKYKEIHGVDESLWMTASEHRKLHNRLRKEGKCDIPAEELINISLKAIKRGDRFLNRIIEYDKTEKKKRYKYEYYKENVKRKIYRKTLERNIRLYEEITYNIKTKTLTVSSGFRGDHGVKLPIFHI